MLPACGCWGEQTRLGWRAIRVGTRASAVGLTRVKTRSEISRRIGYVGEGCISQSWGRNLPIILFMNIQATTRLNVQWLKWKKIVWDIPLHWKPSDWLRPKWKMIVRDTPSLKTILLQIYWYDCLAEACLLWNGRCSEHHHEFRWMHNFPLLVCMTYKWVGQLQPEAFEEEHLSPSTIRYRDTNTPPPPPTHTHTHTRYYRVIIRIEFHDVTGIGRHSATTI